MERRLAAILVADVVGYSRLIRADELGTIAHLQTIRTELLDCAIKSHGGRIVKLMGDGVLAEFASTVEAVRASVEIQRALPQRGRDLSEDKRIVFRIGINLGDVVIDGEDIHGDGVNVAARLESLAEPGGICISNAVQEEIRDRLDVAFEDMGERNLKNIDRPFRTWRWPPKANARSPKRHELRQWSNKPTVAVLPFKNLSEDPDQAYFSEGIREDVVTGLSKNPALLIISHSASPAMHPGGLNAIEAGQHLGAQYLVEGSVRRSGLRTRVSAQLIATASGSRIWAERFDREMGDVFELQDEIVRSIVHALGAADGVIERIARSRSIESPPDTETAYDLYLKGRHSFYTHGDTGFINAEEYYLKAIELDETFAPARSALAWLYFVQFKLFRSKTFAEIRSRAMDQALKALHLDKQEFRAHWVLGGISLHDGNHSQSIAEFDKALLINPNDANLLAWSAEALIYAGHLNEAVERCNYAIRLNPNCPDWYHWIKASGQFHQGDYREALTTLNKMSSPGHGGRLKAAVYAFLGDDDKARAEAQEFMKLAPTFSISKWAQTEHYADPAELERYVEGQRRAGLPD